MAYLKKFIEIRYRVRDPLRPGQYTFDSRLDGDTVSSISHDGRTYEPDENGWFDLPNEVAAFYRARPNWLGPQDVDEKVVSGQLADEDAALPTKQKSPRKRR
jgi:hypothetical protein